MTVRNLNFMFQPSSVALVGASSRPGTVGAVTARNLVEAGFQGEIFLVNPRHGDICGVPTYPDVASLPKPPDLAVIATPPDTVPGLIAELGARGTKAAVVITAGFGEGGNERGRGLCLAMLREARPHLLRIVGPNCVGIMVPGIHLNGSFSHMQPQEGEIAFVAQSGAVITSVLDWASSRYIGFSHLVSLGGMADVDFGDTLDYLANDPGTRAILLYVEAVTQARKFMSAARAAARVKPVIVLKAGRYAEGARAAASHTGAMAGSDAVYDAAFRRAGILRVSDVQALFNAVETLALMRPVTGDRLAILTNGGGMGVIATDVLIEKAGRLATLSPATLERLNALLPPTWSRSNPVDMIGDASGSRYCGSLEALLDDPGVDGVLVMHCPTAVASGIEAAQAVIDTLKKKNRGRSKPHCALTSWLGAGTADAARRAFAANRIPTYQTPPDGVRAFMQMVRYHQSHQMLMETPPTIPEVFTPDVEKARAIVGRALKASREWLTQSEASSLLVAYGIPVVPTHTAADPQECARLAAQCGGAVALKLQSPDIVHKSEIGAVVLDVQTPDMALEAAHAMLERVREALPGVRVTGFALQPMIRRPHARELIMGMVDDDQFGPVILFGQGGTAAEVIGDKALALPPLNMNLARDLMERTRVHRLLEGYRGTPPADRGAVALTLVKLSQMVTDLAEIAELDINPLLADEAGVLALDARVRVIKASMPPAERLAIRPYPKELEDTVRIADGRVLRLRPVRPEDEPAFQGIFARLSPEEIRLRFLHYMKSLPHTLAARLTQLDYDREMALALLQWDGNREGDLYGAVRLSADPDIERAEFAILIRGDMTGMGLGPLLMRRMIEYARKRGIREIFGEVLSENRPMLRLCRAFGFVTKHSPDQSDVLHVSLKLQERV